MDMQNYGSNTRVYSGNKGMLDSDVARHRNHPIVTNWLEIWDYVGGATFRGFIAEDQDARTMFVFFDSGVLNSDLKPG